MKYITLVLSWGMAAVAATNSRMNERCGGTTGLQCGKGLYCNIRNTGSCGVCKVGLKQGDKCGGDRPGAIPCGQGLLCRYPVNTGTGRQGSIEGTCQPEPVHTKAKEGEACGGGTQSAKQCDTGLFCQQRRNLPGATGVCVKEGKEGSACGAFTLIPQPPCGSGLECKLTNPQIPDAGGKCAKPAGKVGDACGAFIFPPQPPCGTGLVCSLINPRIPDAGGKCTRTIGIIGDACGAFFLPPQPPCGPGLRCAPINIRIPDAGGKCIRL